MKKNCMEKSKRKIKQMKNFMPLMSRTLKFYHLVNLIILSNICKSVSHSILLIVLSLRTMYFSYIKAYNLMFVHLY